MLRSLIIAFAIALISHPLLAADESPSTSMVDHFVFTNGDKVSGHVGACLLCLGDRPLAGFGLTKDPDKPAEYTYLLVFKTGGKKFEGSGSGAEVNSDGKKSTYKITFDIGDVEIPLELETVRDDNQKVVSAKTIVGGQTLTDKGSRVVVVDLTKEKPTYQVVKGALPTSVPDLADKEGAGWAKAVKEAIAELKTKQPELEKLID